MINIVKMVETCGGCPSQWDGWDGDGVYYYFRYRWGTLRVDRAQSQDVWPREAETIVSTGYGDGLSGVLDYSMLGHLVSETMTLPSDYKSTYDEL